MRQNGRITELKAKAFDGLMKLADEKPGQVITFGYAEFPEYREYEVRLAHIGGLGGRSNYA